MKAFDLVTFELTPEDVEGESTGLSGGHKC